MQLLFTISFVIIAFILSFSIGSYRANHRKKKKKYKNDKLKNQPDIEKKYQF